MRKVKAKGDDGEEEGDLEEGEEPRGKRRPERGKERDLEGFFFSDKLFQTIFLPRGKLISTLMDKIPPWFFNSQGLSGISRLGGPESLPLQRHCPARNACDVE